MRLLYVLLVLVLLTGCAGCRRDVRDIPSYSFRVTDLLRQEEMVQFANQWNRECQCGDPLSYHPISLSLISVDKEIGGEVSTIGLGGQIWLPVEYIDPTVPGLTRKNYWGFRIYFLESYWDMVTEEQRYLLFMHEMGHGMGLTHNEEDINSIMYPYMGGTGENRSEYWEQVRNWLGGLE